MQGNETIIITQCVNGYTVNRFNTSGVVLGSCDRQTVCQSMQELVQFIRKHFDYRNHNIEVDLDMVKE